MNTRKTTRRTARTTAREQGSLLILCVTVLVIIAMIGISYMQRVRMDQFATARHERGYINQVINGILTEVNTQLKDDVILNRDQPHLLFDYPWTDPNERKFEAVREYPNPTTILVNGYDQVDSPSVVGDDRDPPRDDRWLASTAPVWVPGDNEYRWLHLTNLTGIWLELPDPLVSGAANRPIERPIIYNAAQIGQALRSDTDLAISSNPANGLEFAGPGYLPRGEDADGDGIVDSRWQWTPVSVRNLGGRKYVMALRIVDLSAMINVNTAATVTLDGTAGTPYVARGHSPAWADLSRLMARIPQGPGAVMANGAQWRQELSELLNFRLQPLVADNTLNNPPYSSDFTVLLETTRDVESMWQEQGSIYGNTDRNYLIDSELELRRFGGLNDADIASTLEVQMGQNYPAGQQLSRALRQHPLLTGIPEGSYVNVVGNNGPPEAPISRWFYGSDPGNLSNRDTDSVAVGNREYPAIRHMLTTVGGAAIYAPVLPGTGTDPQTSRFKFGLNRDWDNPGPSLNLALDNLRDQLRPIFKRTRANLGGNYLGLSDSVIDDMVAEMVVAIKDYSDEDNVPTARALPSGGRCYGLEKLPFIREVYTQALYADTDVVDAAGLKPGDAGYAGPDGQFDTWAYDETVTGGDTRAMVIELGNPFNHVIYGTDPNTANGVTEGLAGQVEVRVRQGGTLVGTWLFDNTTPDIQPRNNASNDDTLVLISPPVDKLDTSLASSGTQDGSNLDADLNIPADANVLVLPDGTFGNYTPGDATPIVVELWVDTPDGPVMYDQIELNSAASLPSSIDHPNTPTQAHQFAQASSARDCRNINFVIDDGPGSADSNVNSPSTSWSYATNVDRFGSDNKGTPITPHPDDANFFDRLQLALSDHPMRSLAELGYLHLFGFTNNETFSERMSANHAPVFRKGEHFLLVDPADPDYDVVNSYDLPHAALVMDLFTTISPRIDGNDNDNDDGDNDLATSADSAGSVEELFVPGLMNVNTMPLHLLTLASPLGESLNEVERLMRTIVAYRDEPLRQGLRPSGQHGQYWTAGVAGFDVTQVRNNTLDPDHIPGFPDVQPDDRLNTPGIASLGELLYLNPGGTAANDMLRYGMDGSPNLPNMVDMYPDPNDPDGIVVNQGDDNEQLLARFGMLSQSLSVRSDRFVVYGVVRGYDNDAFNQLPVESARFIAIIDRSGLADDSDTPRVIGFVRLQ